MEQLAIRDQKVGEVTDFRKALQKLFCGIVYLNQPVAS